MAMGGAAGLALVIGVPLLLLAGAGIGVGLTQGLRATGAGDPHAGHSGPAAPSPRR
jgi:hypothetical protein